MRLEKLLIAFLLIQMGCWGYERDYNNILKIFFSNSALKTEKIKAQFDFEPESENDLDIKSYLPSVHNCSSFFFLYGHLHLVFCKLCVNFICQIHLTIKVVRLVQILSSKCTIDLCRANHNEQDMEDHEELSEETLLLPN